MVLFRDDDVAFQVVPSPMAGDGVFQILRSWVFDPAVFD